MPTSSPESHYCRGVTLRPYPVALCSLCTDTGPAPQESPGDDAEGDALDERDAWQDFVESAARAAGCVREWSSEHDHRQCVMDACRSSSPSATPSASETEREKWAEVKRHLGIEERCPADDALDITLGELCDAVLALAERAERAERALADHVAQCPQTKAIVKGAFLAKNDSRCECGHGRKQHYEWAVLMKPLECIVKRCGCSGFDAARASTHRPGGYTMSKHGGNTLCAECDEPWPCKDARASTKEK